MATHVGDRVGAGLNIVELRCGSSVYARSADAIHDIRGECRAVAAPQQREPIADAAASGFEVVSVITRADSDPLRLVLQTYAVSMMAAEIAAVVTALDGRGVSL